MSNLVSLLSPFAFDPFVCSGYLPVGALSKRGTDCHDAPSSSAEETDYARKTFGSQKGISSDMYHQTGSYDANASREAQARLQGFQGASAISSK
jgi:hypothetical protein